MVRGERKSERERERERERKREEEGAAQEGYQAEEQRLQGVIKEKDATIAELQDQVPLPPYLSLSLSRSDTHTHTHTHT